jgi:NAD(P)-dependent dehydrogenase (short-subunit alcohol dehydrogenase family)
MITGAAKAGIGDAITRRLLHDGFSVIGSYEGEDESRAKQLAHEFERDGRLQLHRVVHSVRGELAAFVAKAPGEIAGLVNAQFFFAMEDPERFDHSVWDTSLAVNLTAPNFLAHELKPRIRRGGSIVMITSTEGFIGSFGASAYAATKAAIHNLTKTLANTLGARGVRVNSVAAGWIGGVMDTDEVFNMSRKITPLGRLGTPEEIAAVVAFLISDQASFIDGTVVTADGGYSGVDTISKYEFERANSK